jgi:adenylylsulfate kinase
VSREHGIVVWITGLPSSGKSTLAARVRERLPGAALLDGDELRAVLCAHDYSPEGRDGFYDVLGRLAVMLASQGLIVLVAATAHERRFRDRIRERVPYFMEVWVRAPLEECARRDPKGLYARARHGLGQVPGMDAPYEVPLHPEVVAEGGYDEGAVGRVLAGVRAATVVPALDSQRPTT